MMPHETIEERFADAQKAMEQGDWDAFFSCLDRQSLLTIAKNSFQTLIVYDNDTNAAVIREYRISPDVISQLRDISGSIRESARLVLEARGGDTASMLQRSLEHRNLVEKYDKVIAETLKSIPDLPRFTATMERAMRATTGGGSVSSTIFIGDTLQDIEIDGTKARAVRITARGYPDEIRFIQNKGKWYIRLGAKRV